MSHRGGRRQRTAFAVAVSIVSLGGCAWWASHQEAPTIPTSARALGLLGLAVLTYALITGVRGWRWHVILRRARVQHRTADAYGLTTVAYMGNAVLPVRGGELLRIVLLGQRSTARHSEIIGTLIPERLLDAAALALLFATLSFLGASGLPSGSGLGFVALAAVAGGLLALVAYLRLRVAGHFQRFADRARPLIGASRLLLGSMGARLGAVTIAVWLLESGVLMLVALSLDVRLDLAGATAAVVLASLAATVPAGPGYVGTFDAAALLAFSALGLPGGSAVSLLLMYRAVLFVPIVVAGLALVVARYGGLAALRPRRARPDGA